MTWLFSYGTLRQPEVQTAVFGRLVAGEDDALTGFRLATVAIADPGVVAMSGAAIHPILVPDLAATTPIAGTALRIEADDLAAVDAYEGATYARVAVTLASGRPAQVYIAAA